MKRSLIILVTTSMLIACVGSDEKKEKTSEKKTEDITKHPDYQAGLALVASNKCLTCHNIDMVVTGPPYREIANKYGDYPDTIVSHLANKVISGGTGVWGQVFMTPHPNVTKEDAERMVRYILLLKNK